MVGMVNRMATTKYEFGGYLMFQLFSKRLKGQNKTTGFNLAKIIFLHYIGNDSNLLEPWLTHGTG